MSSARPLVIAHRGASAHAPENTLPAARIAVAHGADLIECDVQRSADGHLVLVHDADLRRTTDVAAVFPDRATAPVAAFTLAELARLSAGPWPDAGDPAAAEPAADDPQWLAHRTADPVRIATLPALVTALDQQSGPRTGLLVEVKDPHRHPGIEAQLLAALADAAPRGPVVLQSFDHSCLRRLAALGAPYPLGLLTEQRPDAALVRDAAGWAHQVNPTADTVDADLVAQVHAHGLGLHTYTVNDAEQLRSLAALGVDGIITDVPQQALAVLTPVAAAV